MYKSTTLFKISFFTFAFWLFSFAVSLAQENKVTKTDATQTTNSKLPNSPQAEEGDVKITDGTNTLIRITDEGTFGAIEINPGTPGNNVNKLYNKDGTLSFSGNPIGVIDNDWTVSGVNMHSTPSGNVGIGTSNPTEKLEVTGKIKTLELQVTTGATDGHVLTSDVNGNATWQANSSSGTSFQIGDMIYGGIVFWIDQTGQHGLICAKRDASQYSWGPDESIQLISNDGIFAGEINTILIAALNQVGTSAADKCITFLSWEGAIGTGTRYGGWYLPSRFELKEMYNNKAIIDATAIANGGYAFITNYWTSEEWSWNSAKSLNFDTGIVTQSSLKTNTFGIRPVHKF